MAQQQLFASFVLDRELDLEMALLAEDVTEAAKVSRKIQPLPSSVDFLEGVMQLREEFIPIINLKRRLGLQETSYNENAKVAVVTVLNQRLGLLFDDIKEIFKVENSAITPVHPTLQTNDKIISNLIKHNETNRALELLDLNYLFLEEQTSASIEESLKPSLNEEKQIIDRQYSHYVIFNCTGREYGVKVEHAQELSFLSDIDELYKDDHIEGALQLRGHTIPIVDASTFLNNIKVENPLSEHRRILVLMSDEILFGLLIDKARQIIAVPEDEILPMPASDNNNVIGIFQQADGKDIMLLDVDGLISSKSSQFKSIGRIRKDVDETGKSLDITHNIITENCYLVFSISKNFAIELVDIQEIIECHEILNIPAATGINDGVINLRGEIIPVVNLRRFYNFPEKSTTQSGTKLIICRLKSQIVALEVDNIVTIYKQEKFYATPSLKPQFKKVQDTLDRLIEFKDNLGIAEHVLVVNVHNLAQNHLRTKEEKK